jgi:2-phospho-L-lactate guanylyltransferase
MSRWIIVPIRGLATGKSRLAEVLDTDQRYALNRLLLERVLSAVAGSEGGLSRCVVASAGAEALALARKRGAIALAEPGDTELNAALESARTYARAGGASSLVILAADLPEVSAAALASLIAAVPAGGTAIVADKHGRGTNGLVLPAASVLRFAFGEGSLARHAAALRQAGVKPVVWDDPALAFDLDSPADYEQWQTRSRQAGAGRPAALSAY